MVLYSSPENSCPILKSMYDSKLHADIQLSANGKKIFAHKAVLSSASEYFKHLIDQNVNIDQYIDWNILEIVIKFIYHGSVEITSIETAIQLIKTANFMELPELLEHSRKYLEENITTEDCFKVYFQARLLKDSSLTNKAKNIIAREFKTITQGDSFKSLDKHSFVELGTDLQDLISEDDIAEGLLTWIKNDKSRLTHFKEFLLLLKIENIACEVIINQLYELCTEKEEYGIIINALQRRKQSTNIAKPNDLKVKSQKLHVLAENNESECSLVEYNFSNKTLLKQTEIPKYGLILGFWGEKVLFNSLCELTIYDVLKKSICSVIDREVYCITNCSKIGDNVYLLDSKNLYKLNLMDHTVEDIVLSKQLQSDCYEFDAMCELNGELKIMAYDRNNGKIHIVTYNPVNNLWNIEPTDLILKRRDFDTIGTIVPHKNCLFYFNCSYLHIYNLADKNWNMRILPYIYSRKINSAVSINDVLFVCTNTGLYEYKEDLKKFEKHDIFENRFIYRISKI